MNSYLGGGSVFTLIGATLSIFLPHCSFKCYWSSFQGLLWVETFGFLDFYIAALDLWIYFRNESEIFWLKLPRNLFLIALITMVIGFLLS